MGSYYDTDFEKAIEQMKNPQDIIFEFMVLLEERVGVEVSADYFSEDTLLDLEASKYEVIRNAEYLLNLGLPMDIVETIICNAPYLMMLSEQEVNERLVKGFGEEFKNIISEMDEDSLFEILDQIAW